MDVIDVEAAFLEADLDEAVYIDWPEGVLELRFEKASDVKDDCIRLNKAMYGTVKPLCNGLRNLWKNC